MEKLTASEWRAIAFAPSPALYGIRHLVSVPALPGELLWDDWWPNMDDVIAIGRYDRGLAWLYPQHYAQFSTPYQTKNSGEAAEIARRLKLIHPDDEFEVYESYPAYTGQEEIGGVAL